MVCARSVAGAPFITQSELRRMRTKIVATVGPATRAQDGIHALSELGVDVLRINMAHGRHEEHAEVIKWAREVCATTDKPLAVLVDLAGPKISIVYRKSTRLNTSNHVH